MKIVIRKAERNLSKGFDITGAIIGATEVGIFSVKADKDLNIIYFPTSLTQKDIDMIQEEIIIQRVSIITGALG